MGPLFDTIVRRSLNEIGSGARFGIPRIIYLPICRNNNGNVVVPGENSRTWRICILIRSTDRDHIERFPEIIVRLCHYCQYMAYANRKLAKANPIGALYWFEQHQEHHLLLVSKMYQYIAGYKAVLSDEDKEQGQVAGTQCLADAKIPKQRIGEKANQ